MDEDTIIELPIDGILDLHTFRPQEVKDLLPGYLTACRERGILAVHIIHGKGTEALRRTVHALLSRLPDPTEHDHHPALSLRLEGDVTRLFPPAVDAALRGSQESSESYPQH